MELLVKPVFFLSFFLFYFFFLKKFLLDLIVCFHYEIKPIQKISFFFLKTSNSNQSKIAVTCSSISNEGNAEWDQTFANGTIVNGNCVSGYYGSVSRNCSQSGPNGIWSSITGSCNGILFFSFSFFSFSFSFSFIYFFIEM